MVQEVGRSAPGAFFFAAAGVMLALKWASYSAALGVQCGLSDFCKLSGLIPLLNCKFYLLLLVWLGRKLLKAF